MCAKFQVQKIHPQKDTSNLPTYVVARDNFTIANFTIANLRPFFHFNEYSVLCSVHCDEMVVVEWEDW